MAVVYMWDTLAFYVLCRILSGRDEPIRVLHLSEK